ncbi:MAG: 30S ribosomal protein S18 [Ruminiclostridium sp.]|jgi:small subunit ribosomal protein S18|nr:30S ribosomal protein S18 [Ruminiclostridium sp.]
MSDPRKRDRNSRDDREANDKRGGRPLRRRTRRKVCQYCVDKVEHIEYKDIGKLRKFLSEKGKILPRRISGNCAKHQRQMTTAIKRARHIALLPYTTD